MRQLFVHLGLVHSQSSRLQSEPAPLIEGAVRAQNTSFTQPSTERSSAVCSRSSFHQETSRLKSLGICA